MANIEEFTQEDRRYGEPVAILESEKRVLVNPSKVLKRGRVYRQDGFLTVEGWLYKQG